MIKKLEFSESEGRQLAQFVLYERWMMNGTWALLQANQQRVGHFRGVFATRTT